MALKGSTVFAWVRSLMSNDGDVYKALGMPGFLARITALRLVILVPVLIVTAQFGLVAVALGHLGTTVIDKALRIYLISRRLQVGVVSVLKQFAPSVMAAFPLVAVASMAMYLTAGLIPLAQLLVTTLAGAVAYLLPIWFLERAALIRILDLIRRPRTKGGGDETGAPA
jgi:hypothetical protein